MNPLEYVHKRLGLKFFLSYLAVIVTGAVVMLAAAQGVAPSAFARHMGGSVPMGEMMGGNMMGGSMTEFMFGDFRRALTEAVLIASGAAVVAAVVVSYLVSRKIVDPVAEMVAVTRDMARGRYSRRVKVSGEDELGDLASNFNAMAEALEETEERRQQLIGDVAHELRTPLTTIRSYMEGLEDGVLPQEPGTYHLVQREAERLTRLVEDLQQLSRAEAKQLDLRTHPVETSSLVRAAVARLQPQYDEKGVILEVVLPDRTPHIMADEDRIIQVLMNVLGNALRHTPVGGEVSVAAVRKEKEVQLSIADNGIGISPEHLPHVFERFFKADRSRSRASGGSGLGLTIAKYLVEAHGGRIWAESAGEGKGSTFSFTLPMAQS
ncbi:MAG: HAMP domain-containing protein [Chloroflexi bacterium]|nr:HAMP domain-containing protein [Chloroflexota bacterium]